jgi:Flp pilus assembly protein TadG
MLFWRKKSRSLIIDCHGGLAVAMGLAAPALALAVGGAVDLAEVMRARAALQRAVDSAALSGAKQMASDRSSATINRVESFGSELAKQLEPRWSPTTTAEMDSKNGKISVTQTATRASLFGLLLPPWTITVSATAVQVAGKPLCVLGLEQSKAQVITGSGMSTLSAPNCLVQSNSAIQVKESASISAGAVHSVLDAAGSISPAPLTDAPAVSDPFAGLAITIPGGCKGEKLELDSGTTTLNPGVHCDKLKLTSTAQLVLNPGDQYFTGGGFDVQDDAQIVGDDVVMIFKGQYKMSFKDRAALSLEARKSGPFAGFVLITDRSFGGKFSISTDRAKNLHGTIYLPKATLEVTGLGNKVADQSPWTVIVADKLDVSQSASLVINANYGSSTVPVPAGVGSNGAVRLSN